MILPGFRSRWIKRGRRSHQCTRDLNRNFHNSFGLSGHPSHAGFQGFALDQLHCVKAATVIQRSPEVINGSNVGCAAQPRHALHAKSVRAQLVTSRGRWHSITLRATLRCNALSRRDSQRPLPQTKFHKEHLRGRTISKSPKTNDALDSFRRLNRRARPK